MIVNLKIINFVYFTELPHLLALLYVGTLSPPPNFYVNTTIIHIITLTWDPPPSLVTVSLYSVAVRINNSFKLIVIHQPFYEYKYNYSGCEIMEVEFGVRADNSAGTGNFSNMTVTIASWCVITPTTTSGNTVVKFTSAPSEAINSTRNSLHFTFTVPIESVPLGSPIDTRDPGRIDLGNCHVRNCATTCMQAIIYCDNTCRACGLHLCPCNCNNTE